MKRVLQIILISIAAYGLYEILDQYFWHASKPARRRPKPVGTQVGGAVLTGGGAGRRADEDHATRVGRGVVAKRSE